MKNKMTFAQFCDWIKFSSATCIHPLPHRYQLDWYLDQNGNVIVDFIGRFEKIKEDWDVVSKRLNIDKALPFLNSNLARRHYSDYYNKKTRDIIMNRFAVDVEYFGYEF